MNVSETPFDLLNRHVKISRETFFRFSLYHDLLQKWQAKINLVGPETISDIWSRHLLDSLQLLNAIPDIKTKIFDLGTGAGFPGMALAIAGATDVHLIESDGKKIAFLKEVARITSTRISIHHHRIEEHPIEPGGVIVSRAFRPLDTLLSLSHPYVSHETICLFHKGKNYSKEIEEASAHWLFDETVIPSVTDSHGVILKLANIRKRGT